jgi:thymidylate kinase
VRQGYLDMAKNDKNVFIIDGTLPRETIQDEIWELLQEKVEKFLR